MLLFYYFTLIIILFLIINNKTKLNKKSVFKENNKSLNLDRVSIVIPFYNEEKVIRKTMEQIINLSLNGELIMVDDGSTDLSCNIVNDVIYNNSKSNFNIKCYHYSHVGCGNAIIEGFKKVNNDIVILTDADGEFSIEEIPLMISEFKRNPDNVIVAKKKSLEFKISILYKLFSYYFEFLLIKPNKNTLLSGTRVFSKNLIKYMNLNKTNFSLIMQLNIEMLKYTDIIEKDITYTRRSIEEGKNFIGLRKIKFIVESLYIILQYKFKIDSQNIKNYDDILSRTQIKHLGMILDGNRRYRKKNKMNEKLQHLIGSFKTLEMIEYIEKSNIQFLTLYLFAENNWKRKEDEIKNIMKLLFNLKKTYLQENSILKNVKLNIVSTNIDKFDNHILKIINDINNFEKKESNLTCNLLISYSGQNEIINAAKNDPNDIRKNLFTYNQPDLDAIIRTGGDIRLSDFMTFQSAYSELFFVNKTFPEFNLVDLKKILIEFEERKRNFGK